MDAQRITNIIIKRLLEVCYLVTAVFIPIFFLYTTEGKEWARGDPSFAILFFEAATFFGFIVTYGVVRKFGKDLDEVQPTKKLMKFHTKNISKNYFLSSLLSGLVLLILWSFNRKLAVLGAIATLIIVHVYRDFCRKDDSPDTKS